MIIRIIDALMTGRALIFVAPRAAVRDACEALNRHNVGALAVLDEADAPGGMVSIRDIPTDYRLMAKRYREYTDSAAPA